MKIEDFKFSYKFVDTYSKKYGVNGITGAVVDKDNNVYDVHLFDNVDKFSDEIIYRVGLRAEFIFALRKCRKFFYYEQIEEDFKEQLKLLEKMYKKDPILVAKIILHWLIGWFPDGLCSYMASVYLEEEDDKSNCTFLHPDFLGAHRLKLVRSKDNKFYVVIMTRRRS